MGSSLDTKLAGLESFLKEHPGITYATPSSANYSSLRATYALANTAVPLAIVRPQNANDVAAVVSYAIAAKIKFTVRSGGNSLFGLSQIQDALTIDMRDIDFVDVDTTKTSARVGGGVLLGKVAADLSKKDLATAVGTVPFVGYVGWCIYGGYGPFSANYGLGLDQIIGARVVNGKGELVVADEEMLKGIRGAGGNLGVIVELTIKVYPLKSILAGMIFFDSSDIGAATQDFLVAYQKLPAEEKPAALMTQPFVVIGPQGKALAVGFVWSSDDHETGRKHLDKFSALSNAVMNNVGPTTISEYMDSVAALVPDNSYGSVCTISLREFNSEAASIIRKYVEIMPVYPGLAISAHELRGPSAAPNSESVFGSREPHYVIECIQTVSAELVDRAREWAESLRNALQQMGPGNVLPGRYISLNPKGDVSVSDIYGSNYETLLELQRKYDPQDVFSLSVPRFYES